MGNASYKVGDITNLRDEFSKMMEDFFGKKDEGVVDYDFIPPLDVIEKGDVVVVEVEVAGIENGDIEISYDKNLLSIKGVKKSRISREDDLYHRIERNYGKFHRNVSIPYFIEEEKITADIKKGVLTVMLPKKSNQEEKIIKINFEE